MVKKQKQTVQPIVHKSKSGLYIGLGVLAMVLAFIGFVVFIFVNFTNAPAGTNSLAERFLKEKIQTDDAADIVIFSKENTEDPVFMQKVESAKQLVRSGGYNSPPQLVRPSRSSGQYSQTVVYKLCKSNGIDCVYFWIATSTRGHYTDYFNLYMSEAEATQGY